MIELLGDLAPALSTTEMNIILRMLRECPMCNYDRISSKEAYLLDIAIVIKHLRSAHFAEGIHLRNRIEKAYGVRLADTGCCVG